MNNIFLEDARTCIWLSRCHIVHFGSSLPGKGNADNGAWVDTINVMHVNDDFADKQ